MTIKEEPQVIEFTYTNPENENISFNITHDPSGWSVEVMEVYYAQGTKPIEMTFPLDFFKEVYEFFASKGVIKGGRKTIPGIAPGSFAGSLLPPEVSKKDDGSASSPSSSTPAFASFDIPVAPGGDDNEQTKTAENEKEQIKIDRPVIRSRKIDPENELEDAARAEQEYAAQRGQSSEKAIKSRHGN
tara:strand:+ start:39329 stop:39889 length:561 start_codon:yes stop_codon:yes gene_type:complete